MFQSFLFSDLFFFWKLQVPKLLASPTIIVHKIKQSEIGNTIIYYIV